MTLPIEQVQCSYETDTNIFIGSQNKLYCVDKTTLDVKSALKLQRNVQAICKAGKSTLLAGE